MESLDRRSLGIGLSIGAIYLLFGFWRTLMFAILVGVGYALSHPDIRMRIIAPVWTNVLSWLDRWRFK